MKRRFLTISIVVTLPLLVIVVIGSMGLFSSSTPRFETYKLHEKQLGILFETYEKEGETMSDAAYDAWKKDVQHVSAQAAGAFIEIQQNAEHWKDYLASTGQPYSPSIFDDPEYTGLAAKTLSEITSDQFDAWLEARDAAYDERQRKQLRADGIWNDQEIEELIASTNEELANDPVRQKNREKMRQAVLSNEKRERDKAEEARKASERSVRDAADEAWHAAEEAWIAEQLANGSFEESSDDSLEQIDDVEDISDAGVFPDDEVQLGPDSSENGVDQQSVPPEQDTRQPSDKSLSPDVFRASLSTEMSRWNDDLMETYSDVFRFDTDFEESLPDDVRQYFRARKERLQFEYVNRLYTVLQKTPVEHRETTLRVVRERLSRDFDRDFAESVLKQLELDEK